VTSSKQNMFITEGGANLFFVFCLVSSLFLLWGFCNGMIDVMDKHFQDELHLTLAQSAWVQFAHYLGYFLMALPAGNLAIKLGYKGGIIAGLLIVAAGGAWFLPATHIAAFWAFLLGVCIIASGLTFLETVANPYVTILGNPNFAAARINLAQSCNGIGWILGPIAGSLFFYSEDAQGRSTGHETLYIPYAGVAIVVLILALIFFFSYVPDLKAKDEYRLDDPTVNVSRSLWTQPHFVFAVVAQFLYVAAQAGIFSFFINYMTSQVPAIPESWNSALDGVANHAGFLHAWLSGWFRKDGTSALAISNKGAANLASLAFVLFLMGRFLGAAVLRKTPGHKLLAIFGALNVLMSLLVFSKLGWLSVACVFASYLFMSIMFPTIFALGIHGLGAQAKRASAFLVMAIMGGAIVPKLMGYVADRFDMSRGFIVPMVCFIFISHYGFKWPQYSRAGQVAA
jgi:FHS family L-fucose permease-like MFS transporter